MPYHSQYQGYPVPEDGENEPPDGFNGALETISDKENWGDVIQTFVRQLEHDTVKSGPLSERPESPDIDDDGEAFYCSTDEGDDNDSARLYIYDITNGWRPITPPPGESGWVPSDWGIIDVSEHGFPGDESGGDVVPFILNNPNSIFVFPEGRYVWGDVVDTHAASEVWNRVALIGEPEATMVAADNSFDEFLHTGYDSTDLDNLIIENITFEIDGPNGIDAGIGKFAVNEFAYVNDIKLSGERWRSEYGGGKYGFRLNMLNKHSGGFVNKLDLTDGDSGADSTNFAGAIAVSVEPPNEGTIVWKSCHVDMWPDNGFYLKDGLGSSIAIGCTASNCGNQNMRLGKGDHVIGGRFDWTVDPATIEYAGGACLEIEHGKGTSVRGAQIHADYAETDLMRCRSGNEHVKFQDVHIENNTPQFSIDCSSTQTNDGEPDEPHGEGYAVFENIRVVNNYEGTQTTRSATVRTTRDNTVFRDCSIETRNPNIGLAPFRVDGGDVTFENCRFVQHADSSAGYTGIIGPSDSAVTVENVTFEKCEFNGVTGPYFYNSDNFNYVGFIGCDFTNLSGSLWPSVDPQDKYDAGEIDEFTFFRNRPYTASTNYGDIHQRGLHGANVTVGGEPAASEPWVTSNSTDESWVIDRFNQRVGDQRYHALTSGSDLEYVKLAQLKDLSQGTNGGGAARFTMNFSENRGNSPVRTIDMVAFAKGSVVDVEYEDNGEHKSNDPYDFVITEEDTVGDGNASDYQYHVYARLVQWAATGVTVTPAGWFGQHDFNSGLAETDLTGTIVFDTDTEPPSKPIRVGDITSNGDPVPTSDAQRKIYVSSTEPTDATADDIWFEPQ